MGTIKAFARDESGVTVVSYGLLSALVSLPLIVFLAAAGRSLSGLLLAVADLVGGAG